MIEFKDNTPTINQVYQYTYTHKLTSTRFKNEERDILPSKLKISLRQVYRKNKEGKFTTPDERLIITSWSAPQYYPYNKVKGKKSKKQLTVKHNYDVIVCIQMSANKTYDFWNSKIVWRVGSQKKWVKNIPQNKVKSIYSETRNRLNHKYSRLSTTEKKLAISKEIKKIKDKAPYLDIGDANSQMYGINGDNYYRNYPLQMRFNCLYGRCFYQDKPKGIDYPFFCKHMLAVIHFLLKKGVIKY